MTERDDAAQRAYRQIRELTARYNRCFDAGDESGWVQTFLTDGVLVTDDTAVSGHEALGHYCRDKIGRYHHMTTDPEVIVDGAGAMQRCSLLLFAVSAGTSSLVGIGRYEDELRLVDNGWRFARRTINLVRAGQGMR